MRKVLLLKVGMIATLLGITGCETTRQPDGSTKVHVSIAGLGRENQSSPPTTSGAVVKQDVMAAGPSKPDPISAGDAPSIRITSLAGVFAKRPYDGTPKTYFPRVAITVIDWSGNNCWTSTATIWWSKTKSDTVPPFSTCWGQSIGYAVNNAANLHLFMQQMAVEHSGNVRTTGPKPPMLAIPDRQPITERQQLAFQGFIQQLLIETGWQPGAPTNLWLVGYDASAAHNLAAISGARNEAARSMNAAANTHLEQALACLSISRQFDQAEAVLKQAGWHRDQGITPVTLAEPVKVYGFNTRKIAVARDGGEQIYRSFLPGISVQQTVKSASLKLGKDGRTYGRVTKLGVLEAGTDNGETTLTCTVNTEGSEG